MPDCRDRRLVEPNTVSSDLATITLLTVRPRERSRRARRPPGLRRSRLIGASDQSSWLVRESAAEEPRNAWTVEAERHRSAGIGGPAPWTECECRGHQGRRRRHQRPSASRHYKVRRRGSSTDRRANTRITCKGRGGPSAGGLCQVHPIVRRPRIYECLQFFRSVRDRLYSHEPWQPSPTPHRIPLTSNLRGRYDHLPVLDILDLNHGRSVRILHRRDRLIRKRYDRLVPTLERTMPQMCSSPPRVWIGNLMKHSSLCCQVVPQNRKDACARRVAS